MNLPRGFRKLRWIYQLFSRGRVETLRRNKALSQTIWSSPIGSSTNLLDHPVLVTSWPGRQIVSLSGVSRVLKVSFICLRDNWGKFSYVSVTATVWIHFPAWLIHNNLTSKLYPPICWTTCFVGRCMKTPRHSIAVWLIWSSPPHPMKRICLEHVHHVFKSNPITKLNLRLQSDWLEQQPSGRFFAYFRRLTGQAAWHNPVIVRFLIYVGAYKIPSTRWTYSKSSLQPSSPVAYFQTSYQFYSQYSVNTVIFSHVCDDRYSDNSSGAGGLI